MSVIKKFDMNILTSLNLNFISVSEYIYVYIYIKYECVFPFDLENST